ncbi:hypothetical protein PBI_MOSMORIS_10 [Mycobacterium phage MosMoris]|uniref:Uncharacterized protein n=1 Tax=Mycobacterium phage MosMoris TaxID=1471542 RepID=A0A023ZWW3_9CAUD|nr:hypothetical protein FH33_gp010 [Mycobacterium phage MosMoris]AHY84084.1 hypothetical protein PBI_MOSMORIS_10 [Mycobacterium phage MosMoris]
MSDRFYVLDCDRCGKTLGWTTNAAFPMCGLTRCTDCGRRSRDSGSTGKEHS